MGQSQVNNEAGGVPSEPIESSALESFGTGRRTLTETESIMLCHCLRLVRNELLLDNRGSEVNGHKIHGLIHGLP